MKILFVCTGNSCRSAMAKGYLEKRLKELGIKDITVFSAGVAALTGMRATEEAKQVVKEAGGDISGHTARKLSDADIKEADLIFAMENSHRERMLNKYPDSANKTYLLRDFRKLGNFGFSKNFDIPDPIAKDINFYRKTFFIIKESIEKLLQEI
ncbi:MAG: low molecular weight protein arginine phosphatase [Candidatus Omnitrophota bacterium]|nr:low molecular weight protein arginine phosphatase [Candidatus Omnitrophota bacterium]